MFTPHTPNEREEMLRAIGVKKIDDLFKDVPEKYRFPQLNLPPALTEMEALTQAQELSMANESTQDMVCFLGAGAYHHYTPAAVDSLLRRGEFYTAYTPYQPEISQGTLQSIFEYQSLIANLTGMDISNASHYDAATASAEAAVLAYHHFRGKRKTVVVSQAVNPQYRETLRTYLNGYEDISILGDEDGTDPFRTPDEMINKIDESTALVLVQYPDFFGRIFDLTTLIEKAHEAGSLVCVATNPNALGLLKPPGAFGADIVVGEGQSLGLPLSFGGPYLGIFALKSDLLRKLSGRLVGETVDQKGRRGFVLTLTAREQHIKREKATSNICTNQGLMALASTIYMSLLGKSGLRQVSELCFQKAHYAAMQIEKIPGYSICVDAPFYHEFTVCCPLPVSEINLHLLDHGIIGGYDLSQDYPTLDRHMLVAFTEMISKEDIDTLCDVLQELSND